LEKAPHVAGEISRVPNKVQAVIFLRIDMSIKGRVWRNSKEKAKKFHDIGGAGLLRLDTV
jgi:hypothetical protein